MTVAAPGASAHLGPAQRHDFRTACAGQHDEPKNIGKVLGDDPSLLRLADHVPEIDRLVVGERALALLVAILLNLGGAVLIEQHDEWEAGDRRYFSEASMAELTATATATAVDEGVMLPEITAA